MTSNANIKGLMRLRSNIKDAKPQYYCSICKCMRYSKCGCVKSKKQL